MFVARSGLLAIGSSRCPDQPPGHGPEPARSRPGTATVSVHMRGQLVSVGGANNDEGC